MFRGYIPTQGKRPIEKVKDREKFYALEEVQHSNSYGGVLADDIILVDIDDKEESELLYNIIQDQNVKCNIIRTTRGMHFYFKNNGVRVNSVGKVCALGITVDVKLGSKKAVVPLKIAGVDREFITKVDELDTMPKWLKVIKNAKNFTDLDEGDGRNQTLFNYILTLQSEGFSKSEATDTLTIINTYIMKKPLEKKELETVLRDDAFIKDSFFNGSQFLHDKFCAFLVSEENVIKANNTLHIYKDGIYSPNPIDIEKAMIKHIPILNKAKRSEVMAYLELIAPVKKLSDGNFTLVNNGILNIDTLELTEFTPNYICTNKIPVNYNPKAKHKVMNNTLNKIACKDKQLRSLLEEMIGYTLLRRNEMGKCFILTGSGSNGKSTLLNIMKKFLGENNISSITLEELGHRFKTAELYGKLSNIGDDISNNYIQDNSVFKKLTTGETVNVERKGKDPFDFTNYSKLIFSANEIPRINDNTDGLLRRLVLVPFNAKFSSKDKDYDPFIIDKLLSQEALEYLLNIALEGLQRVLKNRKFTEVQSVNDSLDTYNRINNPTLLFLEDFKVENEPTSEIYLKYTSWCVQNGLKQLSNIQFGRELNKRGYILKQVRIDGKRIRVYIKGEVTDDSTTNN